MSSSSIDEAAYRLQSKNEVIEIVDIDNNILSPATRGEMRANGWIHRATYAFVRTSNNYFYVQKRSKLKDYCPGYYDPTPGGVVGAGESYELTNEREIEEEMGIKNPSLMNHAFTFYYEDERLKCWGDAWDVVYDGPLKLQEEEVEEVVMMSLNEILDRAANGELFTPDSIHAAQLYLKHMNEKGIDLNPTGSALNVQLIQKEDGKKE